MHSSSDKALAGTGLVIGGRVEDCVTVSQLVTLPGDSLCSLELLLSSLSADPPDPRARTLRRTNPRFVRTVAPHDVALRCIRAVGFADDGDGATFACAECLEGFDTVWHDGHDVALLGFVAPDLHGAHGGVFVVNVAQVEASTGGFDEFGQAVGKSAGADVVNREHWILVAEGDAAVDYLLAAAFHLWVAALDGVKVEGFGL